MTKAAEEPRIRRALLSVSDKSGIVELARSLSRRGIELLSTGGTAKLLSGNGIPVTPVETITGFPEGLDGRVKTLHPNIHAALLADRTKPEHHAFLREHGITPIDLLVINLYPFEQTASEPDTTDQQAIEQIDIGGPAMLRAASKNHASVCVVSDPASYQALLAQLDEHADTTTLEFRRAQATRTFARLSAYDAAIAAHLSSTDDHDNLPETFSQSFRKSRTLRYGENPHQRAALYTPAVSVPGSLASATQHHGKELSYNNLQDASATLSACADLVRVAQDPTLHAAVVVKHTNPCGAAVSGSIESAIELAIAGDPLAAFGGILALSSPVTPRAADVIAREQHFFEVVLAPSYDEDALSILQERWKNVRLLSLDAPPNRWRSATLEHRAIPGGQLVQTIDDRYTDPRGWSHRAGPAPTPETLRSAALLEPLCRWVTSNAVVIGGADDRALTALFGVGSGQVDRLSACRLASEKAGTRARGAIAVSDAFFPFPDGPQRLIEAGVTTIVHPGGSKRDQDTFDVCDASGVTCLTTDTRHFRH